VARSLGRYLGELHATFAFAFDAFGPLRVAADAPAALDADIGSGAAGGDEADGTADGSGTDPLVATGGDDWRRWLSAYGRSGLAALPPASDPLRDDLSALFADPDVPGSATPRLFPWDFRPGNALVAGDDGTVTAVLDWEAPLAAAAPLSAAKAEYLVADWYVPSEAESLRAAFVEGYESVRPYPDVGPAHRAAAVVHSAVDAAGAVTNPHYPELDREASVAFHRRHLEDCP